MSDDILKYPNPILTTPCEDFNFFNPPGDPKELSLALMQFMNDHNAIGLSANQLGIPYKVFVLRGHPENLVCFNPVVVSMSKETDLMDEACISYPGVNVKIKRAKEIRLRFTTPSGITETKSFNGLTARTIQHEMDHLSGIPFINRANRYHRDRAMKGYYNVK